MLTFFTLMLCHCRDMKMLFIVARRWVAMATAWGRARWSASSIVRFSLFFDLQMTPWQSCKGSSNHCLFSLFQKIGHMASPHMSDVPINKCLRGV